jgi:hypothetical protein
MEQQVREQHLALPPSQATLRTFGSELDGELAAQSDSQGRTLPNAHTLRGSLLLS